MQHRQARDRAIEQSRVSLEQHANLLRALAISLPLKNRFDRAQQICASDEILVEQAVGDPACAVLIREGAPDQRAHVAAPLRIPSACMPQARLATSSAPVSWCATATHSETSVRTVAMPSKTITPNAL